MPKLDQKGFSLIEGLLTVIAVLLVVFVGYYVWHSQQNANKTLSDADKNSRVEAPVVNKKAPSSDGMAASFAIKEWGVKAKNNSGMTPLYKLSGDSTGTWAYVSTQELVDAGKGQCNVESGLGGAITRAQPQDEFFSPNGYDFGETVEQAVTKGDLTTAHKVGNYYYWFNGPQAACGDSDQVNAVQAETVKFFKAATDNLTN